MAVGAKDAYAPMVVVGRFSKRVIVVPAREAAKAEVMAEAFYRKVVCNRGTPLLLLETVASAQQLARTPAERRERWILI